MLPFSLIICSRGRPPCLERLLRAVALLHYPAFELIVICDPTDADSAAIVARLASRARFGLCAVANLAMARNTGLAMARGDIVAFLDDDAIPEPDWLDQLAAAYASSEVTAAGGFIRARDGLKFQYRAVLIDEFGGDHRYARIPDQIPPGWFLSLTGTNFSVRRMAALALGGFDENYAYFLEETDFLRRLQNQGSQVCLIAAAEVQHDYAANASRHANGVPKSLRQIARSKAYFAHINRRPDTSLSAVASALKKFTARKLSQINRHFWAERLGADAAARLRAELRQGIHEGEALAKSGRRLAAIPAAGYRVFAPFLMPAPRLRLCVLAATAPRNWPHWPAIHALAQADYEITLITFGAGMSRHVTFAGGLWVHQLPMLRQLFTGTSERAMAAEIKRISPRRRFEKIYLVSPNAAMQRAAAATGLPCFTPAAAALPLG